MLVRSFPRATNITEGRTLIYVMDRGADILTPLIHSILLEPLAYDLFDIDTCTNSLPSYFGRYGRGSFDMRKTTDCLWERVRDRPFYTVNEVLNAKEQVGPCPPPLVEDGGPEGGGAEQHCRHQEAGGGFPRCRAEERMAAQ